MRNRLYGGVRGRKMKVGGNYFIFLLLDLCRCAAFNCPLSVLMVVRTYVPWWLLCVSCAWISACHHHNQCPRW